MSEINWRAGNEERFLEFFQNLVDSDKVAIISHTDCDGISSGKIVSLCVNYEEIYFKNYSELDADFIEELKDKGMNKLIITDLSLTDRNFVERLNEFESVLIIDHHEFESDLNSDKIVFLNAKNYCAAYLSYTLFSEVKNLEEIDWLVACASIADFAYLSNKLFMEETFEKYGEKFYSDDRIKETEFFKRVVVISNALIYYKDDLKKVFDLINENYEDVDDLKKVSDVVQKEIDYWVDKFDKEKELINERYFFVINPKFGVKSIVSTILSVKEINRTFVFVTCENGICTISARRQDLGENVSELLQKLIEGFEDANAGGHVPAAGGHFPERYFDEFKERMKRI